MHTHYDHEALHDLTNVLKTGNVDEVLLFTYFLGRSQRLDPLYTALTPLPHHIFCGSTSHTLRETHSSCLDVLLAFPKLNVFILRDCHAKVWAYRKGTVWHSYVGSYNLHPTSSAQVMVKFRGKAHDGLSTKLRQKVVPLGQEAFAGVPITAIAPKSD